MVKAKTKKKEETKPTPDRATKVEFPLEDDLNNQAFLVEWRGFKETGVHFYVEYAHGTGIFSAETIATHRMEWVRFDDEKGWIKTKPFKYFEPILQYLIKKGAKVSLIDVETAKEIRLRIQKDPASFAPKAKTETKLAKEMVSEPEKEALPHEKPKEDKD